MASTPTPTPTPARRQRPPRNAPAPPGACMARCSFARPPRSTPSCRPGKPGPGAAAAAAPPPHRPCATWRLHGALFFGAAAKIDPIVQAVETGPPGIELVLDASELVALDTTGLDALAQILKAVAARGGRLSVIHLHEQPRSLIARSGFGAQLAAQGLPPDGPEIIDPCADARDRE